MAEYSTEDRNGRLRTELKLAPGEKVSLCRCMKSADFLFCDGTHKLSITHNLDASLGNQSPGCSQIL